MVSGDPVGKLAHFLLLIEAAYLLNFPRGASSGKPKEKEAPKKRCRQKFYRHAPLGEPNTFWRETK
jgi:hypothetical protein